MVLPNSRAQQPRLWSLNYIEDEQGEIRGITLQECGKENPDIAMLAVPCGPGRWEVMLTNSPQDWNAWVHTVQEFGPVIDSGEHYEQPPFTFFQVWGDAEIVMTTVQSALGEMTL